MAQTNLTTTDLIELSHCINQYHIKEFALHELSLSSTEYDNASGQMVFSLWEGVQQGLRMWLNRAGNNAAMLRARIEDGVRKQIINPQLLDMVRTNFSYQVSFNDQDLAVIAKEFTDDGWKEFARVCLKISPEEIQSYLPAKSDTIYPMIRGVLTTWKCKDYDAGTVEVLLMLMRAAKDKGRMNDEPIEYLMTRSAPTALAQLQLQRYQEDSSDELNNL